MDHKWVQHDPQMAVAERLLAEAAKDFATFVGTKTPSLTNAQVIEAAAILLTGIGELFDSSPDLLSCIEKVARFLEER